MIEANKQKTFRKLMANIKMFKVFLCKQASNSIWKKGNPKDWADDSGSEELDPKAGCAFSKEKVLPGFSVGNKCVW